jgi:protein-S-isoprenylcysteine O-methyltransferase Ste14
MSLAWRALGAVLALPGAVAVLVPAGLVASEHPRLPSGLAWLGLIPAILGAAVLLECVRRFAVQGRGTLAPWDPPERLVVQGMYRWVRNPMYVGVLLVLAGWAICFRSIALTSYGLIVAVGFHLRVVLVEEVRLRERFGLAFGDYCERVPRWVPRIFGGRSGTSS